MAMLKISVANKVGSLAINVGQFCALIPMKDTMSSEEMKKNQEPETRNLAFGEALNQLALRVFTL